MKPLLIGLTGGVGVGKSSVAALLKEFGAHVVSGDELGRQALEHSPEALAAVREHYGAAVFSPDRSLLRRELGKRVFSSPAETRWLTGLTFPGIHELWEREVERSASEVIVFDASLIFEWGIENEFDILVVVAADEATARNRMAAGGRLTVGEAAERQAVQADAKRKLKSADVVIENNGSLQLLRQDVQSFWNHTVIPELERRKVKQHG